MNGDAAPSPLFVFVSIWVAGWIGGFTASFFFGAFSDFGSLALLMGGGRHHGMQYDLAFYYLGSALVAAFSLRPLLRGLSQLTIPFVGAFVAFAAGDTVAFLIQRAFFVDRGGTAVIGTFPLTTLASLGITYALVRMFASTPRPKGPETPGAESWT